MVKSKGTYEEIRRQRVEENKKRMGELNLKKLSENLAPQTPKLTPVKKVKPKTPRSLVVSTPVRRSSRVADKPPVSYKEAPLEPLERPRRSYSYQRKNLLNRVYASDEARAYAIYRAEEIQSGLDGDFPSFVKPMLQSHVTGGFWLGLPVQFCKTHLTLNDEMITLVDEEGDDFETKYLADKNGLSGGWRGFAIDHELVDGDALVFQLVSPTEFKVFIIRAHESEDSEDKDNNEENDDDKESDEENDEDKESNEDNEKDLDLTHLRSSARRTRASRE